MAETMANLEKSGAKFGTPTEIYNGDTTYITSNTDLWTATSDGFIIATPVVAQGYGSFLFGTMDMAYYNAGTTLFRATIMGFIKKGEKFKIIVGSGGGVRKDIHAYFIPIKP